MEKGRGAVTPVLPNDYEASGRSFGDAERKYLDEALRNGCLFGPRGNLVRRLEEAAAELFGVAHVRAVGSGTAAVHSALAALDLEPGDEVITSGVTDMGAILPIVMLGGIPVFCDLDPKTLNPTAATIAAKVTSRTRAILVTHLFGRACDMDAIMSVARANGIRVIEDAAQAFLARDRGRLVGTIGDIGCFSLQQGKHATCGEGGLVLCSDPVLARRIRLFGDKAWPFGERDADHEFLSTNLRMSELQAAVALAQIEKLPALVEQRCRTVERFRQALKPYPQGLDVPGSPADGRHTYWRVPIFVDPAAIAGGADGVGGRLEALGVRSTPRYIKKPAFECRVFQEVSTFGRSRWPFSVWEQATGRAWKNDRADFPGTMEGLSRVVVLPWNERYTDEHADYVAKCVREAVNGVGVLEAKA